MKVELLEFTRQNPVLSPESLAGVSDLATLFNGKGTFAENVIEYAGRVCYQSTHRMGTADNFISARVREGHEDIIEHAVATVHITDSDEPLTWRTINRHCEVTSLGDGGWIVSANLRVWLDFFRRGIAEEAMAHVIPVAPKVFEELGWDYHFLSNPPAAPTPLSGTDPLYPSGVLPQRVTLLGYSLPGVDNVALADHGSATFLFEGISRACTHQLVRHRLASFSQVSMRYVDLAKGGWGIVVPPAIEENEQARQILDDAWEHLQTAYAQLRAVGIRKEDARCLLPNATETRIVVTINFAAWSHFLWLRAVDKAAQLEIRLMGQEVLKKLYAIAPGVFTEHMKAYERMVDDKTQE